MPDCEDPEVKWVELPGDHPPTHRGAIEAELPELRRGYHAVLSGRQVRKSHPGTAWAASLSVSDTHVAHPSSIARAAYRDTCVRDKARAGA